MPSWRHQFPDDTRPGVETNHAKFHVRTPSSFEVVKAHAQTERIAFFAYIILSLL